VNHQELKNDVRDVASIRVHGVSISATLLIAILFLAIPARAEEKAPEGVVPLAPLGGDFWTSPTLTGDWGGARSDLARKGVQFDFGWYQTVQSVVDGGLDTRTRYGGNLDLVITLDLMRMGIMPGAFVKLRAESRYGESVNDASGQILPVNSTAFFPLTEKLDDTLPIALTDLTYFQFFSKQFGLLVGKLDTLDADPNEFASGRGNKQFMNANFIFNSIVSVAGPYSTLGAGLVIMPNDFISINSSVSATTDSSRTSGFETLNDGLSWSTEADLQYRCGQLPGGFNVGACYAWDNNFTALGQRLVFTRGQGFSAPQKHDTWFAYASGWQYLCAEGVKEGPIRAGDGRLDYKGLGLFWRAGVADSATSLVSWSISGGLGGRGAIPGRDEDTWGVGYFYTRLQDERLIQRVGVRDYSQGFETFYNIALTGWAHLTLDVQVTDSLIPKTDTGVLLGARLETRF
jgi:porin